MLYKSKFLTLETMSIVVWAQVAVFTHVLPYDVDDWDRWFMGRAPRTRVTLPDFCESCRVTRHSRVFHGLTGSQRTPGFWGVTDCQKKTQKKRRKKKAEEKKKSLKYYV